MSDTIHTRDVGRLMPVVSERHDRRQQKKHKQKKRRNRNHPDDQAVEDLLDHDLEDLLDDDTPLVTLDDDQDPPAEPPSLDVLL